MRKIILTIAALGGFFALSGLAAQAAPMPHWSGTGNVGARAETTPINYYWRHHYWRHDHWHQAHWHHRHWWHHHWD